MGAVLIVHCVALGIVIVYGTYSWQLKIGNSDGQKLKTGDESHQ